MREYKVYYLSTDKAICSTYVDASSNDEARQLVFNRVPHCVKTLSAECTS